jgi:hypothetical protein
VRYLLRFDDLTPTMNWRIWDQIERLLDEHSVQPLLAVVPDNRDPELRIDPPNPLFWERARNWQSKGWIIAQHGFQHVYDSVNAGQLHWWAQSEFAGHPRDLQLHRIRSGLSAMEANGLHPVAWAAPSHTFDADTLGALQQSGIHVISDGFGWRSRRDSRGLTWIPVQPWRPLLANQGIWSACLHHNGMKDIRRFRDFVHKHAHQMIGPHCSFQDLVAEATDCHAVDVAIERLSIIVMQLRRRTKGILNTRDGREQ